MSGKSLFGGVKGGLVLMDSEIRRMYVSRDRKPNSTEPGQDLAASLGDCLLSFFYFTIACLFGSGADPDRQRASRCCYAQEARVILTVSVVTHRVARVGKHGKVPYRTSYSDASYSTPRNKEGSRPDLCELSPVFLSFLSTIS